MTGLQDENLYSMKTREHWLQIMLKIAQPVYGALSAGQLRARMPVDPAAASSGWIYCQHAEALARSLAGLAPWLELDSAVGPEAELQAGWRERVRASLANAFMPERADFLEFKGPQALVEAAFLAHGLLRGWSQIWRKLPPEVQQNVIEGLKSTRMQTPYFCNWLLFPAMVEAFLCKAGCEDWDPMRIDYALRQHEQWYLGDGMYADGPEFHWDYYNSFVILPMLHDILHADDKITARWNEFRRPALGRMRRQAAIQERLIAPDGTFPPIGRSLSYRFGAFHLLAQVALQGNIPETMSPAGVRCALTAVLRRVLSAEGTFDDEGWLRKGLAGHQPDLAEGYISRGSLYLCMLVFLPLGLPDANPFWSDPDCGWTSKRIWEGENLSADHAYKE
jgi:hypothetical protein